MQVVRSGNESVATGRRPRNHRKRHDGGRRVASPRYRRTPQVPTGEADIETVESRWRPALLVVTLGLLVAGVVSAVVVGGEKTVPPLATSSASAPRPDTTRPSTAGPTTSTTLAPPESSNPEPTTAAPEATAIDPGENRAPPPPTPTTTGEPTSTDRTTPVATTTTTAPERPGAITGNSVLDALNRDRTGQGLAALRVRSDLQAKAQAWAERLAREGPLYHSTLGDGLETCWTGLGENLAEASSVALAEQLLMADPPHRANILGSWDWVGVGVAPSAGGVVVVQVFMAGCP